MEGVNPRTTTAFMKSPADCIFVCVQEDLAELKGLAGPLHRKDVQLHTAAIIQPGQLYAAGAGRPREVVVDWQVKLTPTQESVLRAHRNLVNNYRPPMAGNVK